jgi:ubiquinone biosynthesis protein COQ4
VNAQPQATTKKRDWRRAWKAVRVLIADSSRTEEVFELLGALEGPVDEKLFREFASQPEGRKLLEEKPRLLEALSDRARLRELPEGSFGRTYLAFVEKNGIDAAGLVEADAAAGAAERERHLDADQRWFAARGRDSHDLWHTLTGYGTDEAGEASLLAFTFASYPNPGIAVILLFAALLGPKTLSFQWERYLWQAYRRGSQAQLNFARYEDWLPLPLAEVRQKAGIVPAERAHQGIGIIEGGREEGRATAFVLPS